MSICSHCVVTHARQGKTKAHVLSEISSVLKAQEDLEHKLALVRETSMEQTRRRTAEEEEIEREKQMVSAEFKAEEEKRMREVENCRRELEAKVAQLAKEAALMNAAAEEEGRLRKTEEEHRMRELEAEQERIKALSEEEARRWKADEDELIFEKQHLEETLARVKVVVPFSSVLNSTASSSLTSPRSLPPIHPDVTVAIAQTASHLDDEVHRELKPWFCKIGFAENDAENLVVRFSRPSFSVTNRALMLSLDDEDIDDILEGCPVAHKKIITKALKREKRVDGEMVP